MVCRATIFKHKGRCRGDQPGRPNGDWLGCHNMTKPDKPLPNRQSIRLQGYDYSQKGVYFVTICTRQKACLFGEIRAGKMILNELGTTAKHCWHLISQTRSNVALDMSVVMPNHLHGIIAILDRGETAATGVKKNLWRSKSLSPGSLGAIIGQFKRAVTLRSKSLAQPPEQPLWQRNYYEHIIRNESSLNDIRKYIIENPARWLDDSLYVE